MNILEIKNNLVKISYDVNDNLALADFVIIEDTNSPYVAQVMNIKAESDSNYAIVKLLFTFNEEGILKSYNGTIPSQQATISKLPSAEILEVIPAETPFFIGNIAQQNVSLKVDKSILESNLLICSNNLLNTSKLIYNFANQIDEKVVIIDPDGQFDFAEKLIAGKDFKLPLNSDAIDFIYENDLEDVDAVNKAIIQDILIEVQGYIKTLPEGFLPFGTFVSVIDSQYKETKIPELILLKNKLLKYKELGIFAENIKEAMSLSIAIEQAQMPVLDLSDAFDNLQKEIIRYIYTVLNNINEKMYVFAKVNNANITKKLLKRYLTKDNTFTTIICPHELKYIEEAKESSQNVIFFAPLTISHDFASYNTYLNKLNDDEFVIYGAHTQNIPLIVEVTDTSSQVINNDEDNSENNEIDQIEDENTVEDIVDDVFDMSDVEVPEETPDNTSAEDDIIDTGEIIDISDEEEYPTEVIENSEDKESETVVTEPSDIEIIEEVKPIDNILAEDDEISDDGTVFETLDQQDELSDDILDSNDDFTDIVEEPETEKNISEEDSIDVQEEIITEEDNSELVEQVAKDVDKAFFEKLPEEDDEIPSQNDDFSDSLTEDDLNIIDELSSDDIPLAGDDGADEVPTEEEEQPPVVPIYPAEDIEERDNLTFEPGDRVSTAKYGEGIVEKMIKYGNKMLCSIEFPEIGRRLLDPAMTEITRLS